jgi:hypothetical protein
LNEKVRDILNSHTPEPLDKEAIGRVDTILAGAKEMHPVDR